MSLSVEIQAIKAGGGDDRERAPTSATESTNEYGENSTSKRKPAAVFHANNRQMQYNMTQINRVRGQKVSFFFFVFKPNGIDKTFVDTTAQ